MIAANASGWAVMTAHNRKELAAAIRAVPHNAPTLVVFMRPNKAPLTYRFNYASHKEDDWRRPGVHETFRIIGLNMSGQAQSKLTREKCIDLRLERIAKAILKAEKGLFE